MYKNDDNDKLTNPKIMNLFISSLKSLHKQQESKKKNYKKLMNLFSVRVQRYDDSSSYKTDEMKTKKCDIANRINKKRKNRMMKDSNTTPIKKILIEEYESFGKEYEYNSESDIYKKDIIDDDNDKNSDSFTSKHIENRKTYSLSKTHFAKNERTKILKHRFKEQVDLARSKKFPKDLIDTSVYNSYKSINSSEKKVNTKSNERIVNYYLIKSIENEDNIFNKGDIDVQYDENYKCYYSLDHKSRIIYIKTSPKFLSSLSSIFNSKIVSKKTTKNISQNQSKFTQTPKQENENIITFDHETIIEKLKNIESLRNDVENQVYISEDENYSDNS
jgi:hypothetical protein